MPSFRIIYQVIVISYVLFAKTDEINVFDDIKSTMDRVTAENCAYLNTDELHLSLDSVSHLPDNKFIYANFIPPNRTALVYLHNMALSRSFFWTFIIQSRHLYSNDVDNKINPGMMYHLLSTVVDVSSNPFVNASAVYLSPNHAYLGHFYEKFDKFGPRTMRGKVFDLTNTYDVSDHAADTVEANEWYRLWLSDSEKVEYQVEIRYSNGINKTFNFYGPSDRHRLPNQVKFTRPYFDCGRSNKWLIAAVSPIADVYPEKMKNIKEVTIYTAISVMEMEFQRIDINQCPVSDGNDGPNKYADSAKCKKETTECKPINGKGLERESYQCQCKPGYRPPSNVTKPFTFDVIENASPVQYDKDFDCIPIINRQKLPFFWGKYSLPAQDELLQHHSMYSGTPNSPKLNITKFFNFFNNISRENCKNFPKEDLELHEDFAYGASNFFTGEIHMASRLAHFISAFLQITGPNADNQFKESPLTEDQMLGEAFALFLGYSTIVDAGIYWDENQFANRKLFAPLAFHKRFGDTHFDLDDLARIDDPKEVYIEKLWFKSLKQRFSNDFNLEQFDLNIRLQVNADVNDDKINASYRAGSVNAGVWTKPFFDCDGHKRWLITYAVPFFGWSNSKVNLEFKGAVAISINLLYLDVNQCDDVATTNAFQGTHKCDRETSYYVHQPGNWFSWGVNVCRLRVPI